LKDDPVKRRVQDTFSAAAENYVRSRTHSEGPDLRRMVELAQPTGEELVLDVATGGGHTALAFAPHVREVVATDFTPEMLTAAERFIRGRGIINVRFQAADAESLPFPDGTFDIVTTRVAPHHFPNPERYVAEVARVLRSGGVFVLDDNIAPEDDELDAFLNRLEKWRDPSHVRSHRVSQWRAWIEQAGLTVEHVEPMEWKQYAFQEWTSRTLMPEEERDRLEAWLLEAPHRAAEFFRIEIEDGRVISAWTMFAIIVSRRP
jgi:ubiquinone/menaquinone biosynthesis C-methylase UbiE